MYAPVPSKPRDNRLGRTAAKHAQACVRKGSVQIMQHVVSLYLRSAYGETTWRPLIPCWKMRTPDGV